MQPTEEDGIPMTTNHGRVSPALRARTTALLACALGLACNNDSTTSQNDSSSSTGEGSSDSSASNPTTTAGSDDTTTSTTDATMTTAQDSTGGSCLIAPQLMADPSFESGADASAWGEASSLFGTPLCDASCNGPTASNGSWFMWLGGSGSGTDVGGVSQVVTINEFDSATLRFDFFYGAANPGDVFQLQIDGNVVWEVTPEEAADYADWTPVEIDVTAYADGADHDFDFTGSAVAGSNIYLDNVTLESCGDGAAVTEGDTVDPAMTGGGTTDTDPTGEPLMCEDIGSTVPFTQMGSNDGAGDHGTGSCTADFGQNPGEDVGYTWTAPAAGTYRFDTLDSTIDDTVLYVLEDCMGGAELACNDDVSGDEYRSAVTMSLAADQTITIVVDGWSDMVVGDFVLNIAQVACEAPTDLGNNEPLSYDDDNMGAGDDVSSSCGGIGGEDSIYTWQAQDDGIYAIYAVSLDMSPVVSAFASGECGSPSNELGCATGDNFAVFNTVLAADQEIVVVVDGASAAEVGNYELNIEQTGVLSGDCCAADDSPGCVDVATTQCVCGFDVPADVQAPYPDPSDCCSGEWTAECASLAGSQCAAGCTAVDAGTCCMGDSGMPLCSVGEVQDCVCAFDSYCCDTDWDASCVAKAVLFCNADCG